MFLQHLTLITILLYSNAYALPVHIRPISHARLNSGFKRTTSPGSGHNVGVAGIIDIQSSNGNIEASLALAPNLLDASMFLLSANFVNKTVIYFTPLENDPSNSSMNVTTPMGKKVQLRVPIFDPSLTVEVPFCASFLTAPSEIEVTPCSATKSDEQTFLYDPQTRSIVPQYSMSMNQSTSGFFVKIAEDKPAEEVRLVFSPINAAASMSKQMQLNFNTSSWIADDTQPIFDDNDTVPVPAGADADPTLALSAYNTSSVPSLSQNTSLSPEQNTTHMADDVTMASTNATVNSTFAPDLIMTHKNNAEVIIHEPTTTINSSNSTVPDDSHPLQVSSINEANNGSTSNLTLSSSSLPDNNTSELAGNSTMEEGQAMRVSSINGADNSTASNLTLALFASNTTTTQQFDQLNNTNGTILANVSRIGDNSISPQSMNTTIDADNSTSTDTAGQSTGSNTDSFTVASVPKMMKDGDGKDSATIVNNHNGTETIMATIPECVGPCTVVVFVEEKPGDQENLPPPPRMTNTTRKREQIAPLITPGSDRIGMISSSGTIHHTNSSVNLSSDTRVMEK